MTRLDHRMLPSTEKLKLEARIGELEIALNETTIMLAKCQPFDPLWMEDRKGAYEEMQARVIANRKILPFERSE